MEIRCEGQGNGEHPLQLKGHWDQFATIKKTPGVKKLFKKF